jgi:hypothetical protein
VSWASTFATGGVFSNETVGLGRIITYTFYNKPSSITLGTTTITFADDPDHQRFQQVSPQGTTLHFDAFGIHASTSSTSSGQRMDPRRSGRLHHGLIIPGAQDLPLVSLYR